MALPPIAALRLVSLLGLLPVAFGQIRVMTPEWLTRQFAATRGRIEGSTAMFGAPFYGDRILGHLVWGDSLNNHTHCREDDYHVPPPDTFTSTSNYEAVRLINIIMVRRGKCSFTTKVRVAYEKGAHAVIIVDREDSELTSKDMANIIVADDGFGDKIHIPSVLISKEDGRQLIVAAKSSQVIVELAWDIPTNHVVQVDMWMSSASLESLKFLRELAPKRKVLNEVLIFNPHYAVFSMDGSDPAVYNDLCSDQTGKFCAEDPDGAGPITGKMVLQEDARQLCIHELHKVARTSAQDLHVATLPVEYAAKYWDYVERLLERCPLEAANPQDRFGQDCSERLMREVGIKVEDVQRCVSQTTTAKLQHERDNPAWSPRALRINGWRYSGILDASLVTRAICSGFINEPAECKMLNGQPRDPFAPLDAQPIGSDGVSFGQLIAWLFGTSVLGFGAMLLYKRYLKKDLRTTLREEVMLEVQAQMGAYSQMK